MNSEKLIGTYSLSGYWSGYVLASSLPIANLTERRVCRRKSLKELRRLNKVIEIDKGNLLDRYI